MTATATESSTPSNVFTGGGVTPYNALHPHFSDGLNVVLDGVTATHYENTDISTTGLQLAVVCHENGHQLFGWPDLYPVSGSSVGNLKGFCLMGMVFGGNPPHPNAYLKIEAGWMNPHVLDPELASNFLRSDVNTASILTHAYGTSGTESYILENRQQVGRDEGIADSGIAIYRVIEDGDNVSVVLVEADGDYAMLEGANGTSTDLWSGTRRDRIRLRDDSRGDLEQRRLQHDAGSPTSAPTPPLMTFVYEEYDPAPVAIRPWPDAISAPWTLTGPGGVLQEGAGYEDLVLPGRPELHGHLRGRPPVDHADEFAGDRVRAGRRGRHLLQRILRNARGSAVGVGVVRHGGTRSLRP